MTDSTADFIVSKQSGIGRLCLMHLLQSLPIMLNLLYTVLLPATTTPTVLKYAVLVGLPGYHKAYDPCAPICLSSTPAVYCYKAMIRPTGSRQPYRTGT